MTVELSSYSIKVVFMSFAKASVFLGFQSEPNLDNYIGKFLNS